MYGVEDLVTLSSWGAYAGGGVTLKGGAALLPYVFTVFAEELSSVLLNFGERKDWLYSKEQDLETHWT